MKKTIIFLAIFLLAVPAVFSGCPCNEDNNEEIIKTVAAASENVTQKIDEIKQKIQERNLTGNQTIDQVKERVQEMLQSKNLTVLRERIHTGLENALTKVENENARQRLQTNLERFQKRYQQRLQHLENLTIEDVNNETGAVRLRARRRVRFLGFIRGRAVKRFNIDENGNIEERAPWYRFLYTEIDEEETEVNETE